MRHSCYMNTARGFRRAQGRTAQRPRQSSAPRHDWNLRRRSNVAFLLFPSLYKPYTEALANVFGMQRRFQYAQGHTTQRPRQTPSLAPAGTFVSVQVLRSFRTRRCTNHTPKHLQMFFDGEQRRGIHAVGSAHPRICRCANISSCFQCSIAAFSLRSPLVSHRISHFYCLPFPYTANECAPIVNRTSRDQIHALTAVAGL